MNEFIREQLEISEDAKDQLEETLAETREQLETEQAERTRVQDELDSLRSYTQALVDPATGRPQDIVALRRALDASEEALTSARTSMGAMRVQISVLQGDNGVLQTELDLVHDALESNASWLNQEGFPVVTALHQINQVMDSLGARARAVLEEHDEGDPALSTALGRFCRETCIRLGRMNVKIKEFKQGFSFLRSWGVVEEAVVKSGWCPYEIPPFEAYLGGNVCAKILSDPLQLGPRAKTLRQEVHFSYHTQLSDHQELLRSSRNLSQKMTPWHKEHSNGLRSQDHILRTQARLCARPSLPDSQQVDPQARVRWKEDTLMHDVELSDRQDFIRGQAGILIGKLPSNGPKTLRWPLFAEPYLTSPSSDFRKSGTLQKFEKKRAGRKTRFSSRTAAFARRVFPARNKLIYEPGCVGKIMTPATSWNSRFAESIPRLIGIFTGKVHENSSDTPTSGSHNSLIRTPIQANFISVGKRTSRAFRRYAA
uniref:Uncharacterized protein n=1 Tax=Fagus sylvatica TaxID=28930 RepID=A0A2N9H6U8_FAGSY